mmetsp:Transcript_44496/g.100567  ORF Transcript_44496/g.100567 Transcript_44496/m.100567 type:complete len:581 (-) Transcript_44496:34-1776(-)
MAPGAVQQVRHWAGEAVQAILRHEGDGFLLLLTAAAELEWPPGLWLTFAGALAAFAVAGRRNPAFAFRSDHGGNGRGGFVFAVVAGPALLATYNGVLVAAQSVPPAAVSVAVLWAGSLQALLDFAGVPGAPGAVSLPGLAPHAAQVLTLACMVRTIAELPLLPTCVFLIIQKLVHYWCFRKSCWGRSFSPTEGLLWAQWAATFATTTLQGYAHGFAHWSLLRLFSSVLVLFTWLFLGLVTTSRSALGQRLGLAGPLSPLVAGAVCLLLFLGWLATGLGGWALRSPDLPPWRWLCRILVVPAHARLLLLQWPALILVGVGAIDFLACRSPTLGGRAGRCGVGAECGNTARVRVLYRKAFHALAVALFAPPLAEGLAPFLSLAFLVASLLFVVLEVCRVCRVPYLARTMELFMSRYLDTREDTSRGDLVLTHLYLLLGCAIPVWLEPEDEEPALLDAGARGAAVASCTEAMLLRSSGILLVGIGDACAAACGVRFGRTKWPCTHRTAEGSAAFLAGILVMAALAHRAACGSSEIAAVGEWLPSFLGAVSLSALFEAYSQSIDNLTLPLYFAPTYRVLRALTM